MSDQRLPSAAPQYSPDGRWWWDGAQWLPVAGASPKRRPVSPTGIALIIVGLVVLILLVLLSAMRIGSTHRVDPELDRQICQTFPEDC